MKAKRNKIEAYLQSHGGVARFSSILRAGFHPDALKNLEKENKIEKVGKGLYRLTSYTLGSHPDYLLSSLQASKGIICLVSALYFHKATTEIPRVIDIAIPSGARANRIKYPPVKFYRFSPKAWEAGIEKYEIAGHEVRIYSLAKTIADCFKFRNKIGTDVASDAVKVAVTEKGVKPKEIMYYAKICRVDRIIKPILEAIL